MLQQHRPGSRWWWMAVVTVVLVLVFGAFGGAGPALADDPPTTQTPPDCTATPDVWPCNDPIGGWLQQHVGGPLEKATGRINSMFQFMSDPEGTLKKALTGAAVDATTGWVMTVLSPSAKDMIILSDMATNRLAPGRVPFVKHAWAQVWVITFVVFVLAILVQAFITVRHAGSQRFNLKDVGAWLGYPLYTAGLARMSLFLIDLCINWQNAMWTHAVQGASACVILYGHGCPGGAGDGGLSAVAAALLTGDMGLFTAFVSLGLLWFLRLLLNLNWFFLVVGAIFAPLHLQVSGASRDKAPLKGYVKLALRSLLVQSYVGVGFWFLVGMRASVANAEPSTKVWLTTFDATGWLMIGTIVTLIFVVIFTWLWPTLTSMLASPLFLGVASTLEGGGTWLATLGSIIAVGTANPAWLVAGQHASRIGNGIAGAGRKARSAGEAMQQVEAQGGGLRNSWETVRRHLDQSRLDPRSRRVAEGLAPDEPYSVATTPDGRTKITAASGLAGAVSSQMTARKVKLDIASQEYQAAEADAKPIFSAIAPILAQPHLKEKDGRIEVAMEGKQREALAKLLSRSLPDQVTHHAGDSLSVDAKHKAVVELAVAQVVSQARMENGRMHMHLPAAQAQDALNAVQREGLSLRSTGAFTAHASGVDAATIKRALAEAEKTLLAQEGYYTWGNRFVVVKHGKPGENPYRIVNSVPAGMTNLGDWGSRGALNL